MGKLSIVGNAEREVKYNAIELCTTFYIHAKTTADALRMSMEQGERFLEKIVAAGVDLKDIHIGDNSVDQQYDDGEMDVCATREMKIRLPFDMPFVNGLWKMICELGFDVDLDCDYHLTNTQELHAELLKEALADSRKKADFIAETMGQKIVGIDHVSHHRYRDSNFLCREQERCPDLPSSSPTMRLSDKIDAPLTTESENIEVVWLME